VFNVLLGILDDGRVTDAKGRTVNFANTVIIMTSNLGAEHLLTMLQAKADRKAVKQQVLQAARTFFRPEFLNRLDDIVVFDPLSDDQMTEVARLIVNELNKRLAAKNITLELSEDALQFAAREATIAAGNVYGARPLRRWLEQNVITDMSRMIVAGTLHENSDVLCTTLQDAQRQPPASVPWMQGTSQLSYRVTPKPRLSGDGDMEQDTATLDKFKRSRLMEPDTADPFEVDDEGGMVY